MALKRQFYLNNNPVQPPKNAPEMSIKMNFEKDALDASGNRKLSLSITELEWVRDNADIVNNYLNTGNIFQGLPMRYELERGGVTEKIFDGYLDLADNATFSPLMCVAPAKQRQSIDWLNDTADSVSFEYLATPVAEGGAGIITDADYKLMPYIISNVPDYMQAATALLTLYVIEQQFEQVIQSFKDLEVDFSSVLATITSIIKIGFLIAYIILLIKAALFLINAMVNYIIQPVKYHVCMNVLTILTKGASYFGFTFDCDALSKTPLDKLTFMPEKFYNIPITNGKDKGLFGLTKPTVINQRGYPSGTWGDFVRSIKTLLKSKLVISGTKLSLVPEYQNTGGSVYTLPPLEHLQVTEFKTNASELKANYLLQFQTDLSDKNTIQEYAGTSYQVITTPVNIIDPTLNLLKGLEEVNIPFALAKTKTSLTTPERLFGDFYDIFHKIDNAMTSVSNGCIKAYNAIAGEMNKTIQAMALVGVKIKFQAKKFPLIPKIPIGKLYENRIGMLKIETDQFSVPKLFLMDMGSKDKYNKINPNNSTIVTASYFYNNFHGPAVSFLPSPGRPNGNQYIIKQFDKVPFNYDDFTKVKKNNNIFTSDNKQAIIEEGQWNDWHENASLRIRISQMFTLDANGNPTIRETRFEPDGR